jgi:hypothetical protein
VALFCNSETNEDNKTARTGLETLTEVQHSSLCFLAIYRVIHDDVLTSGAYYPRGYSQSEMAYRNNSDSQRLWIHNYRILKKILKFSFLNLQQLFKMTSLSLSLSTHPALSVYRECSSHHLIGIALFIRLQQ